MLLSLAETQRLKSKYGEWAVITGATSGIGLELARNLATAGFNLLISGRNEEKLYKIIQHLKTKYGIDVKAVCADLSNQKSVDEIIRASQELNTGLIILAAGYGTSGLFTESSLHAEMDMLKVNCEAVLSLAHYYSQYFMKQKRGGIIFMSSIVAFQGVPYAASYAATKAYIQSFAEALAEELRPFNVDVLAAAPGPVESGFGQRANMNMGKSLKPSDISIPILKSLGRKTTAFPGLLTKILVGSLRTVPRWGKVKIMAKVMAGFTKHQRMD